MHQRMALIVEDDASLRTVYRHVLEPIGYTVLEAESGHDAINLLQQYTPNILFLDMLLPHTSGSQVLEYVCNTPHLQYMQVVIVTSNGRFERSHEAARAHAFIHKPILPTQIRELAEMA
jgi:CheY-like chemotaxis protein